MDDAETLLHGVEDERTRRVRLLAARDDIRRTRANILSRRGGVPIDVGSALDELRGRSAEADVDLVSSEAMDTDSAGGSILSAHGEEHRRRALAALDRLEELHRDILKRRGGVPIDVQSVLDELRGRTDESGSN